SINFHCSSVSCLRVTTVFLPDPPCRGTRIGKIDHNITQALVLDAGDVVEVTLGTNNFDHADDTEYKNA
ncbi:hypothetical protein, partial [Streptomyces sp. NBRC 13847]|uniref:hypothetical protein n=1 Tax=Streptomyces sp. NBRC 13847 TaxID=3030991 RepID=UPI002553C93B